MSSSSFNFFSSLFSYCNCSTWDLRKLLKSSYFWTSYSSSNALCCTYSMLDSWRSFTSFCDSILSFSFAKASFIFVRVLLSNGLFDLREYLRSIEQCESWSRRYMKSSCWGVDIFMSISSNLVYGLGFCGVLVMSDRSFNFEIVIDIYN